MYFVGGNRPDPEYSGGARQAFYKLLDQNPALKDRIKVNYVSDGVTE